jgi:hypothetical protein
MCVLLMFFAEMGELIFTRVSCATVSFLHARVLIVADNNIVFGRRSFNDMRGILLSATDPVSAAGALQLLQSSVSLLLPHVCRYMSRYIC